LAASLFSTWHREQGLPAVRLLGVGLGGLVPASQLDLLSQPAAPDRDAQPHQHGQDRGSTDSVVDAIRAKFGPGAVRRANVLEQPTERADGFTEVRRKD
jgi:hypothetical protein